MAVPLGRTRRLTLGRRFNAPDSWPELAFGAFATVCIAAMIAAPRWQGVPFHLIWAGVTVLYAYRQWSPRSTAPVLAIVCLTTGGLVAVRGVSGTARVLELADLPMMTLMFLVMVRVAHQRSEALRRVSRSADHERQFVRDASHQLRTPITIARGHVELIARGDLGPDAAEDAEIVLHELTRLQRISDRLLLLASAEHPGFLALEVVPLGEIVAAAAARWTPVADRDWMVHAEELGTGLVDRARIDCALDTLIENAIKATSPGDPIALGALGRAELSVFVVADPGFGIPAEDRVRIFERFARSSIRGGSTWGGTGLGLPLVRAIAEAHGGTADLIEPPNGWTTFEIRLPRFEPAPGADHLRSATQESSLRN
jgi:signal transduction histidine kinase